MSELFEELLDQVKGILFKRRRAYQRVLNKDDPDTQLILADLARFCRANSTTFLPDDRASAVLDGRREVWLRIQNHLQLSEDELWELHKRKD